MRKLLLSLAILLSIGIRAADEFWALKTSTGDVVRMSDVRYLLEIGGAKTFSVVCADRTIDGVTQVSFIKTTPAGISTVRKAPANDLSPHIVDGSLTLVGLPEGTLIKIYTMGGLQLKAVRATAGSVKVDVTQLPTGVYLLVAAGQSIKFMKQ